MIAQALQSGDPRPLQPADALTLLDRATRLAVQLQTRQTGIVANIYRGGETLDLSLNHTTSSATITPIAPMPSASVMVAPFILSDNNSGMAALSEVQTGRGLAYGADVLNWMANGTREAQHAPLFRRAFTWLMRGDANAALPASISFGTAGYTAATVKKYIATTGKQGQEVACDIANVANTCWQQADLLVFGAGVKADPGLTALVGKYLAAGKAVIYMHNNWTESAGGRQVLVAMGMTLGGYPGNYFAGAAGVSVSQARTSAQSLAQSDQIGNLPNVLRMLANDSLVYDFSTDRAPTAPIDKIHNDLAGFDGRGNAVFGSADTELYRLLVLWADLWRPNIEYGRGLSKTGSSAAFLRAYASDSWTHYSRSATTVSPKGQGDYMPAAAQGIPVIAEEEIVVSIAQSAGKTAIGRAAVPGKPVTVEILEATEGSSYGMQTSHIRTAGSPFEDMYARPRRPQSFAVPLKLGRSSTFVTPFGGPLFLNYSGATGGSTVKLRIKGGAKYAHFDFSGAAPSDTEIAEASAALLRKDFGWVTGKFVGGEFQQSMKYSSGITDPRAWIVGGIKGILFDSNHIANGYSNMPLSANVKTTCDSLGWICDGPLHRAPGVQHFVGWIATCGYLCSGNPSDGFAGIGPGWGWAHELGHNTVQRVMHMDFGSGRGCVTECDNNNLAVAQTLWAYAVQGIDQNAGRTDHVLLYQHIQANRATNLSGEALRSDMETRFWGGSASAKMAFWMQLSFLYTKERLGQAQPTVATALEYHNLLTKGDRLVAKAWDAANPGKYGMGRFADNKISNEDLLFVLSSKIIGKDLRKIFAMYGLPVSQKALDSVADLKLPVAERSFYAIAAGKSNRLATGQWVNVEGLVPAYPF